MPHRTRRASLVATLAALLLSAPVATPAIGATEAAAQRPLDFADLAPRSGKKGGAMQLWSYHFFLQDGVEISLQLSEANLKPVFGEVAGIELSVLGLTPDDHRLTRGFDAAGTVFSTDPAELRIRPDIWIRGDLADGHRVRCVVTRNDIRYDIDLELRDVVRGPAREENRYRLENRQEITLEVPIAFSRVDGIVTVGSESREVEGVAVMEHIVLSTWAARLLSEAVYMFDLGPSWRVGYFMTTSRRHGSRLLGYALAGGADGGTELELPAVLEVLETQRRKGVAVPTRVEIGTAGERALRLDLEEPRQAFSLLGEISGTLRWLAELFIGGEPWVFRGAGELDGATRLHYAMMIID